ncbi:hypothetical protein SPRG_02621 [Saprolegnia parasitica CBS 223.65]|uniref:Uncharacterized protein n=1 Tax=Saprolegnia parasitica (strain CBS 223.65) TaxID=695850 RepID=A0A067CQY1_SAPPC|nr:hypothetical protein SPRG_02621 [Saprolegnia parasitica CBS 223.65]KDO32928.1 hypothetical protein SPRG_02621 [Saprolegnia parasitica CBS 223.65]|eukprot:XP_012196575.1 hypothetical protein SPRG_02621 [Saprolegnia parasitica CBS 223.65]
MTTTTTATQSATKIAEAQGLFARVVKAEMDMLLETDIPREVAVKILLQRIVEEMVEPTDAEVRKVMVQFRINRDDAIRALIVKQELGRLKQRGLDSLAAIEELTLKMQRLLPLASVVQDDNDAEEEIDHDMFSTAPVASPTDAENETGAHPSLVFHAVDACPSPDSAQLQRKKSLSPRPVSSPVHVASPEHETDACASPSWREASLCQQIGNVSISSTSPSKESESTAAAIVDSPLIKVSRKRRMPTDADADHRSSSGKGRFGKSKKPRLDVDSKLKAQVESKLKAQAGDSFVLVKTPAKASKRSRPKEAATTDAPYCAKKARSEAS